jgi:hypothetical protein
MFNHLSGVFDESFDPFVLKKKVRGKKIMEIDE